MPGLEPGTQQGRDESHGLVRIAETGPLSILGHVIMFIIS